MRKLHRLLALALLAASGTATAGTVLLDTGYNHSLPGYYGFGGQDDYWIKIASYEPPGSGTTTVPVARAFVVPPGGYFPLGNARWLSPRPSNLSTPGTTQGRPAYSIFRKCFCLLDGYANPQINFAVRGDDNIQVWLNSVTNTLVPPSHGMLSSNPPRQYPSAQYPANPSYFRTGRNCLYVLVEDNVQSGSIGFILSGTISAAGIMPTPSTGLNGNFGRCGCPSEPNSAEGPQGAPLANGDQQTVAAIVRFAERRRLLALSQKPNGPRVEIGGQGH